jgi:hypothetical protein
VPQGLAEHGHLIDPIKSRMQPPAYRRPLGSEDLIYLTTAKMHQDAPSAASRKANEQHVASQPR